VPWYAISAEFVGALLFIPVIYARWASVYAVPLMIGAAHFWLVRKGFDILRGGLRTPDCLHDPAARPGTSWRWTLRAQAIAASWNF
jgi:hypothetical protein